MAAIRDLLDSVLPFAHGAPEEAGLWAFRRAAREFFTKTLAWQKELQFSAVAGSEQPTLAPGAGLEVFDAVQCWLGEDRLTKATNAKQMRQLGVGSAAEPTYFWIAAPNTLVIAPAVKVAGEPVTVLGCVRPSLTATEIDDAIVAKYWDTLESGTLSYLLRMPKKAWTDYPGANEHNDRFQFEIDRQSVLAVDGGVGTPRRVRYGGL